IGRDFAAHSGVGGVPVLRHRDDCAVRRAALGLTDRLVERIAVGLVKSRIPASLALVDTFSHPPVAALRPQPRRRESRVESLANPWGMGIAAYQNHSYSCGWNRMSVAT